MKYKPVIKKPAKAMFVLGSGGHTSEMFRLITELNTLLYSPRVYVRAATDEFSEVKAKNFEGKHRDYIVETIPRVREVHQSIFSVPFTAILPFLKAPILLLRHRPDVLVVNGPGTCIPLVMWSFIFGVLCLGRPVTVYVESFCRVDTLSLTGRIVIHFVDRFVVQWKELHDKYKNRTRFYGILV